MFEKVYELKTDNLDPKLVYIQARIAEAMGGKAIIAGGAMRDWHFERPRKDVDVFVESRRDLGGFKRTLEEKLISSLGTPERYMVGVEYLRWDRHVTGFANWTIMGEDVQVVGLDHRPMWLDIVLNRIDFGACQIGYDGKRIRYTKGFKVDADNQTFTLLRAETQDDWERALGRFARLNSSKYPGWTLRFDGDPAELPTYAEIMEEVSPL